MLTNKDKQSLQAAIDANNRERGKSVSRAATQKEANRIGLAVLTKRGFKL